MLSETILTEDPHYMQFNTLHDTTYIMLLNILIYMIIIFILRHFFHIFIIFKFKVNDGPAPLLPQRALLHINNEFMEQI